MNVAILMGRLTRDASVRSYGENNDKKMARFTIACDRRGKKEEGQQTADFIGCICYGKLADFADNYLRQGTKVAVQGSVSTGKYEDKDGKTVYTTDILLNNIEFAESKRTADQNGQVSAPTTQTAQTAKPAAKTEEWMSIPEGVVENLPWE